MKKLSLALFFFASLASAKNVDLVISKFEGRVTVATPAEAKVGVGLHSLLPMNEDVAAELERLKDSTTKTCKLQVYESVKADGDRDYLLYKIIRCEGDDTL